MKLVPYLEARFGADAATLVRTIRENRGDEKSYINPAEIRRLLPLATTIEDLVAFYSLVRLRLVGPMPAREQHLLLIEIGQLLAKQPLPGCLERSKSMVRDVTLISAVNIPPHLYLAFHYAFALLTQERIRRVNIVFTGERDGWGALQEERRAQALDQVLTEWNTRVNRVAQSYPALRQAAERVRIVLVPASDEWAGLIGDVVIRFEGPAPFNTTTIYGEAIHAARAVVTGTFSSLTRKGVYSDLTLTRSAPADATQVQFRPPGIHEAGVLPSRRPEHGELNVVTAYTQGRVLAGLKSLTADDWDAVAGLLRVAPQLRWRLVGASDPGLAAQAIPPGVRDEFDARIQVSGMVELERLYAETFALLCFPKSFGGGRAAMLASAAGVPVLVPSDANLDISNLMPPGSHYESFVQALALVARWVEDEAARQTFVKTQQEFEQQRFLLPERGAELVRILDQVVASRTGMAGTLANAAT